MVNLASGVSNRIEYRIFRILRIPKPLIRFDNPSNSTRILTTANHQNTHHTEAKTTNINKLEVINSNIVIFLYIFAYLCSYAISIKHWNMCNRLCCPLYIVYWLLQHPALLYIFLQLYSTLHKMVKRKLVKVGDTK